MGIGGRSLVWVVLLALLWQGSGIEIEIKPVALAPGSCHSNAECDPQQICSEDGICIIDGPGTLPSTRLMSPWAATGLALACALIACCIMFIAGALWVRPHRVTPEMWTDVEAALMSLVFCTSVCCCVITGIAIGLPLGLMQNVVEPAIRGNGSMCSNVDALVCAPYHCDMRNDECWTSCTLDNECTSGFICTPSGHCVSSLLNVEEDRRRHNAGVGLVVMVTFGVFFGSLCVCGVVSRMRRWRARRAVPFAVCWSGLTAMAFGLPMAVSVNEIAELPASYGNGTACAGNGACTPYMCDTRVGLCFEQCAGLYPATCAQGYSCTHPSSGECSLTAPTGMEYQAMGKWMTVAVALSCATLCAWMCVCMCRKYPPLPLQCGLICFVVVALTVGLPLGLVKHTLRPAGMPGNGTACTTADAEICEPYYCDIMSGKCLDSCAKDYDCMPSTQCRSGRCVASTVEVSTTLPGYIAFLVTLTIAVVTTYLVVIGCAWFVGFRRPVNNAYTAEDAMKMRRVVFSGIVWFTCVVVIVGCISGFTPRSTQPTGPLAANTTCEVLEAGNCLPYYCDLYSQSCLSGCTKDEECRGTHPVCSSGHCTEGIEVHPIGVKYSILLIAVTISVVCLVAGCIAARCVGCNMQMRYMYGIRLNRVPTIVCAMVIASLFGALYVGLPLLNAEHVRVPLSPGDGLPCSSLHSIQCEPYFCDLRYSFCHTVCDNSWECSGGYTCDQKHRICKIEQQGGFIGLTAVFAIVLFSIIAAILLLPSVRRSLRARAEAAQQAIAEVRRREMAEIQRRQMDIKPVELNIHPAAAGEDPTDMPTAAQRIGENTEESGAGISESVALLSAPAERSLCIVCMTEPASTRVTDCQHGMCQVCAQRSLESMAEQGQFPARCPGCAAAAGLQAPPQSSLIPSDFIERLILKAIITADFGRRFIHLQILKAFSPKDVISCPCCQLLSIKPDFESKRVQGPNRTKCQCENCNTEFCGNCNVLWHDHENLTCEGYAKTQRRGIDRQTERVIFSTSKQCPNCSAPFSHYRNHACHHIMPGSGCPNCGYHFCCVCLRRHPCGSTEHGNFCDERCDCTLCPDCTPGHPCPICDGCPACTIAPAAAPDGLHQPLAPGVPEPGQPRPHDRQALFRHAAQRPDQDNSGSSSSDSPSSDDELALLRRGRDRRPRAGVVMAPRGVREEDVDWRHVVGDADFWAPVAVPGRAAPVVEETGVRTSDGTEEHDGDASITTEDLVTTSTA